MATQQIKLQRNVERTLLLGFFQVFLVIIPIAVPFFQSKGLSMQDVFVLQALFSIVVVLAEVPSGYIADVFGRKRTMVVGALFYAAGNSLLVGAEGFWGLALFEVCLGIGAALISGADLALMYDTELALGRSKEQQRLVVGRLYGVRTTSEALAGLACTIVLAIWSMRDVVLLQAIVGWLPLVFALRIHEPPGKRLEGLGHMDNMLKIFRHMFTHSRVLRLVFLALCIWSLTTFYAVWLIQKVWQLQGVPLVHFGWMWGALTLIAALAGRWAHIAEMRMGTRGVLVFVGLAPAVGYVGLEWLGVVGSLIASSTFFIARGFGLVILRDALNKRVPSEFRATANSLASFGFRGAFALTGPLVGYSFDLWGMRTTLTLLAFASAIIALGIIVPLALAVRSEQRAAACST